MRAGLCLFVLMTCLLLAPCAPIAAQDKGPPEKIEKNEPPAKYERDGTVMVVHYLLAGIATLLIMVLICMPMRRE